MKSIILGALLVGLSACQASVPISPAPYLPRVAVSNQVDGGAIEVRIGGGMRTLAAAKTVADIDHFVIKLYDNGGVLRYTYTSPDATGGVTFTTVPNGTYYITAEAYDSGNVSITAGGAQTSSNTATVSSPQVTYSDGGSALSVGLKLLDGTGEALDSSVTVTPGDDYAGPITTSP